VIVFFTPLTVSSQIGTSDNSVGQIIRKSGRVFIIRKGKAIPVNNFGALFQNEDKIKTDKNGKAKLSFDNGDEVFLAPSTEITVNEDDFSSQKKGVNSFLLSVWGKIRAKVRKSSDKELRVKTVTATIGIKGTDFIVDYSVSDRKTTVGTLKGLVSLQSNKTRKVVNIPANKQTSVPANGEILPLSAFSGVLLKGVEFAGESMEEEDFMGGKLKM
jgi:hypothetical protein